MSRAIHLHRVAVLLLAGMTAAGAVAAGKKPLEPARKTADTVAPNGASAEAPGAESRRAKRARADAQPAVSNPYDVPLIKNAGSLPVPR